MATIYLNPTGKATGATGSSEDPIRSFAPINGVVGAGDTIVPADGDYPDSFAPLKSGTAQAPITVKGMGAARLLRAVKLAGRAYISLEGLHLHSVGSSWLVDSETSHHNSLLNCQLDSEYTGTDFTFFGMRINGKYNRILGNRFGRWLGGDALQMWGDYNRLYSDFSRCDAPHGCFMVYGSHNDIGGTAEKPMNVTNRLGRAGEINRVGTTGGENNHAHHIRALNCNWDGKAIPQGCFTENGKLGALQMFKAGGIGLRFHDIEVSGTRNFGVEDQLFAACIHLSSFIFGGASNPRVTNTIQDCDFYNLILENNALNGFAITRASDLPLAFADVRLRDSIFQGNAHDLWLQDGAHLAEFFLSKNVIPGKIRRGAKTYTIDTYQQAYPGTTSGNLALVPQPVPTPVPQPVPAPTPAQPQIQITINAPAGTLITVNGVPVPLKTV